MPTVRFDQILPIVWEGIKCGAIGVDDELEDFSRMVMRISRRGDASQRLRSFGREVAEEGEERRARRDEGGSE